MTVLNGVDELAVRLLGPFEVTVGERAVTVNTGRLRALLAVLAVSAGRPVPVERLVAALWGEELPENPRRSVQTYLARLRGALGADAIVAGPAGYRLEMAPDRVDVLGFGRLLDEAERAAGADAERSLLGRALALWRGAPFQDVPSEWLEHTEAPRLLERYLVALQRRIDLDIAAGRHRELAAELSELTARHPLREPLWVRQLIVLDLGGRQAEALERYGAVREFLATQLGVDPGPELQAVYADLLAGRSTLPAGAAPAAPAAPLPRQLPAEVDAFAGRQRQLKELRSLLPDGRHATGAVVMVHGAAGVGKTTLAVHWAHQVRDRFPDGQLYLNLRGYDRAGAAVGPGEALRAVLPALGVPQDQLPPEPDALASLYRSLLADKRVLVLLDNARDPAQVRPLLPAGPGCLALVTARGQLSGLVTADGAHPVAVDLLTPDEARQLLGNRLGRERLAAEPDAVDEIVERCARLPLALAIVAARAATHPGFTLAALAAELRQSWSTLDAFANADPATDVRAVFSWSYRTLTPPAARLFRLLSLHPGPHLAAVAAASLAGLPVRRVRALLGELTQAHLLEERAPGRYGFHDLLRAYAAELAEEHRHTGAPADGDPLLRLLDHYLRAAHAAVQVIYPHDDPIPLGPAPPGVAVPERVSGYDQALAWFAAEHQTLTSLVGHAAGHGHPSHAWRLAWTLMEFLDRRGHWGEALDLHHTALVAARREGDRRAQARTHLHLARAHNRLARFEDAERELRAAIEQYRQAGNRTGGGQAHLALGAVCERLGRQDEALELDRAALELFRAARHPVGEAEALNALAWDHVQLGDHATGIALCRQALEACRELGERHGAAAAWDTLGFAHHRTGDREQAVACYRQALELYRTLSDRYNEADVLTHLGDAHEALGDARAALAAWRDAHAILDDLDHPAAAGLREKIDGLARPVLS